MDDNMGADNIMENIDMASFFGGQLQKTPRA
jgi:hypothetical protein